MLEAVDKPVENVNNFLYLFAGAPAYVSRRRGGSGIFPQMLCKICVKKVCKYDVFNRIIKFLHNVF